MSADSNYNVGLIYFDQKQAAFCFMGFIYIIPTQINAAENQPAQRLGELVETLSSINQEMPDAKVLVVDASPAALLEDQKQSFIQIIDLFAQHHTHPMIRKLMSEGSQDDFEQIAELNTIVSLAWVVGAALKNELFAEDDLITVIEPGTILTPAYLEQVRNNPSCKEKAALSRSPQDAQAVFDKRLWTFPSCLASEILSALMDSAEYHLNILEERREPVVIDPLFKFLNSSSIYYTRFF